MLESLCQSESCAHSIPNSRRPKLPPPTIPNSRGPPSQTPAANHPKLPLPTIPNTRCPPSQTPAAHRSCSAGAAHLSRSRSSCRGLAPHTPASLGTAGSDTLAPCASRHTCRLDLTGPGSPETPTSADQTREGNLSCGHTARMRPQRKGGSTSAG